MTSLKTLLITAGLIFTSGVIFRGLSSNPSHEQPTLREGIRVAPQAVTSRTFEEVRYIENWTVGGEDAHELPVLFGPLGIELGPMGHLFVMDYGDLRVKELAPDGSLLRIFGRGQGQGPGELAGISDLVVEADRVQILDPWNNRALRFDRAGALIGTVKFTDQKPWRFEAIGEEMILMSFFGDHLFTRIDDAHSPRFRFGEFLENQARNASALDGWITTTDDGMLLYAGNRAGLLVATTLTGEILYLVETIDSVGLPNMMHGKDFSGIDPGSENTSYSLSVDGSELFVFTRIPNGLKKIGVIDVYNVADGAYRYSLKAPGPTLAVMVSGDLLYTVTNRATTQWEMGRPA